MLAVLVACIRYGEMNRMEPKDRVHRVGEIEPDGVRAREETNHDDGLPAAINEVPRRVVYGDMDMPKPRRDF